MTLPTAEDRGVHDRVDRDDRALNHIWVDFRYVAVDHEVWALGEMLRVLEASVERLARRYETVRLRQLRRAGAENDEGERSQASQDIYEMRESVMPRLVRGPFLVALWATFEIGISVIAKERADEIKATVHMDDLRGSVLDRARKYFPGVLGIPFDIDPARLQRLNALYVVRNAFAHSNGRREAVEPGRWKQVEAVLTPEMLDRSREFLLLSDSYLRTAYDDVAGALDELLTAARGIGGQPARDEA